MTALVDVPVADMSTWGEPGECRFTRYEEPETLRVEWRITRADPRIAVLAEVLEYLHDNGSGLYIRSDFDLRVIRVFDDIGQEFTYRIAAWDARRNVYLAVWPD